jgi:glycosyltransferase involved in cell wall biosynthesis
MPERLSLSVVVMAFNEQDCLPVVLDALVRYLEGNPRLSRWEVVVVDDGSTDRTGQLADEWALRHPEVRVAHHDRNRGMGAAIRTGYGMARMDYVTQLPADGQVPPVTLDLFLPHVPAHDLVLSVYQERGDGLVRKFLSRSYRLVSRLILGQRADYTGTMLLKRSLLADATITTDSFVANLEVPLKALNRGARACIVTFSPSPRLHGGTRAASARRILFVLRELVALRGRGL